MTMTAELRNPAAFDGYLTSFRVDHAFTFHIIVNVTDAEDIKICIAEARGIICKECLLNLRIPRRYIYIVIPVNFSAFLSCIV